MKPLAFSLTSSFLLLISQSPLGAGTIYGNNYGGTAHIAVIDSITGNVTSQFDAAPGNGRGVVVVGNTLYYTVASSNAVYSYNLTTNTDNGAAFTVAGASGLSTIAYDGTDFWIGDYSGTNAAYLYSPGGTLLKTIHLQNCSGYCDGLEFFQDPITGAGRLISNRGDTVGPYDVYDTNGNLLTANFITAKANAVTGIAYDGADFFVSEIFNHSLEEFTNTGTYVNTITLTGNTGSGIEDLSANYSIVLQQSPEPGSVFLFGGGLLSVSAFLGARHLTSRRKLRPARS